MVLNFIKNFDTAKAVVLAIIAVLGSWYDLRTEVKVNANELTSYRQESNIRFNAVESAEVRNENDIRLVTKAIGDDIRQLREQGTKKK